MTPFSPSYTPVIKTKEVKASKAPKAKPNVFDNGTPAERMAHAAKPIATPKRGVDLKPSTM